MSPNQQIQPTHRPNLPASQGTLIEQTRAEAEVKAAVAAAKSFPRDLNAAMTGMRESCKQPALAERAFFQFPRGGQKVTGPTVHLARELARVWGNIQYGITELSRDDVKGESEMQAFAWDVQTNTRSAQIFIVPHIRDTKGGGQKLTDMRDVYENNANMGARRVREAIFAVLPPWFTEEAKALCMKTLQGDTEKPLAARVADAVAAFEQRGISAAQLEAKLGRPASKWDGPDLGRLNVTYQSLSRGESTIAEEFPSKPVTVDELTGEIPEPVS